MRRERIRQRLGRRAAMALGVVRLNDIRQVGGLVVVSPRELDVQFMSDVRKHGQVADHVRAQQIGSPHGVPSVRPETGCVGRLHLPVVPRGRIRFHLQSEPVVGVHADAVRGPVVVAGRPFRVANVPRTALPVDGRGTENRRLLFLQELGLVAGGHPDVRRCACHVGPGERDNAPGGERHADGLPLPAERVVLRGQGGIDGDDGKARVGIHERHAVRAVGG